MLRQEELRVKSFKDLSRAFYTSFIFSLMANSITTVLTIAYVAFGFGAELNPVMIIELKAFGLWVLPVHIVLILSYYLLFYLTMKRTQMTSGRFKLWTAVLVLIPILSSFDLAFDLKSAF